ncbi:MAG: hypothetical protein E7F47_01995 [Peptoniphilus harei]|nr:hypothetical protein [Peptoniphilus harei]
MKDIRLLKANEIDVRVQMVNQNYISVLLYKDARVDMKILDETFGPMNWQRHHDVINNNLFCTVSIYDEDKKQWISKQDVGIPSYTQAEKGEASDSFKRACINIGIGRELYSAPGIFITPQQGEVTQNKGKYQTKSKFYVKEIEYDNEREIAYLVIVDGKGNQRYSWGRKTQAQPPVANNKPMNTQDISQLDGYRVEIANMLKVKQIPPERLVAWLKQNYKVDKLEKLNPTQFRTVHDEVARW